MDQPDALNLLAATGPSPDCAGKLRLYGQFVGSWDIAVTWRDQQGDRKEGRGEWHFAWILGGRGIQDVLFSAGAAPDQFGTTLRCYDARTDAWHIMWMQPSAGEFVLLTGRQAGDRIVQEGAGADPRRRERWSFTEITPESFRWLGEVSFDQGATWVLEQEMRAVRRTRPTAARRP